MQHENIYRLFLSIPAAVDCAKSDISANAPRYVAGRMVRIGTAIERPRIRGSVRSSGSGSGSGRETGQPPKRKPYWKVIESKLITAFEKFSMNKAPTINVILIWGIMPMLMLTYWLMYYNLKSEHDQWYAYFVSRQAEIFVLSWITYIGFKGTKHAGIATAVMILSGFELVAECLAINTKGSIFDVAWKLVISVLLFYAFRHYIRNARQQ